jgi:hypothetical protein
LELATKNIQQESSLSFATTGELIEKLYFLLPIERIKISDKLAKMRRFLLSSTVFSFALMAAHGFVGPTHPSATRTETTTTSSSLLKSAVADAENKQTSTEKETMVLFSPCKINLFLRIIRKREDGFHDLASLFQAIGFGDTLELTPLKKEGVTKDEFTCNMAGVPTDSSNLVVRALELMREKTGVSQYFQTNLIKQVPAQAGLGGGSANAATAMWGANELMGNPASLEEVSKE